MRHYLTVPVTATMYVCDTESLDCLPTVEAVQDEILNMRGILDGLIQVDPERVMAILVPLDTNGEPIAQNYYVTPTRTIAPEDCVNPPVVGFSVEEVRDEVQAQARDNLVRLTAMLNNRKADQP